MEATAVQKAIMEAANVRTKDGRVGYVISKDYKIGGNALLYVDGVSKAVSVPYEDIELAPDVSRKVKLQYQEFSFATGRDEWKFHELDYDPSKFATKEEAARGLYEVLAKLCREQGLNPDIEMSITDPEETKKRGYGRCWRVSWESGPHEWAIGLSLQLRGPWGYTEPYYSFDLCFTD